MADGFKVEEHIAAEPARVWTALTDFGNAGTWMPGIDGLKPAAGGEPGVGSVLTFTSRGKERETRITALEPGRRLELTSTQGGVTAAYDYRVEPETDGAKVTLDARCTATGWWKLVHPLIVVAMRKADAPQLANLKKTIETT